MRHLSLVFAALLSLFILPSAGWAVPIVVANITSQCTTGVPTITVTLDLTSWGYWKNKQLYYHNPPGSPGVLWPANTNPVTFNVTSSGSFQISDSSSPNCPICSQPPSAYTLATCVGAKKGMTWIHSKSDAKFGTITVGCSGCDAHHGDTACTALRPLLCIYKPTPPFQLPKDLDTSGANNLWSGGVVATTQPVAGSTFADIAAANSYCQDKFGAGWRVAEFHDAGNWNFQAYGGTVSAPTVPSTRFWVHINDQTDGNCWK